jgi:REP element-mobilizing transposase RayT
MFGTVSNLICHVVFGIAEDSRRITRDVREDLYLYVGNTIHCHGAALIEIAGRPDHLHLLLQLRSEHSVSRAVLLIKTSSAQWMERHRDGHRPFSWRPGFAAFSIGESQIPALSHWLRNHDRCGDRQLFSDELVALLRQHRVTLGGGVPMV